MCSPDRSAEKKMLRRVMLDQRKALKPEQKTEYDRKLAETFLSLPQIKEASLVYVYLSYGTEIDTHSLVQELLKRGKRLAAPRVEKCRIWFYEICGMEDTAEGYKGIPEPKESCRKAADAKAPVIMPGLAFTPKGERLGYGGGYYDRFLAEEEEHETIALCYPFQLVEKLPFEATDRRVDRIVTPEQVIQCR